MTMHPSRRFRPQPAAPRRKAAPWLVALACALPLGAWCLPTGEQVVSGTVTVARPTNTSMTINQTTATGIVNWLGFNIGGGEAVTVTQPSASSVLLNRVVPGEVALTPTSILGALRANGRVYVVNPAGIIFGNTATVDVGSLVATSLSLSDAAFLANPKSLSLGDGTLTGAVQNDGRLSTVVDPGGTHGTIALIAPNVRNTGTITANGGTVALGTGTLATLVIDAVGDGLTKLNLTINAGTQGLSLDNSGTLAADGGRVTMTAPYDFAALAVNQTGVVQARSLVNKNGTIILDAGNVGTLNVSGTVDASAPSGSGLSGGTIALGGNSVKLTGATVDASGDASGGRIQLGWAATVAGNSTANNFADNVDAASQIRADGRAGPGGTIDITSAAGTLQVAGAVTARGGPGSSGGVVTLAQPFGTGIDLTGLAADASAAGGIPGKLVIGQSGAFTITGTTAAAIGSALSSGTNVTASTANNEGLNDIVLAAGVTIAKTAGADTTLHFDAGNSIGLDTGSAIRASGPGRLNVEFNPSSAGGPGAIVMQSATIATNGGNVTMAGQGFPATVGQQAGRANGTIQGPFDSAAPDGILLANSSIDTVGAAGGGNIVLRGAGYPAAAQSAPGSGVVLSASSLNSGSGSIVIDGVGSPGGRGVALIGNVEVPTSVTSGSGSIAVTGIADWDASPNAVSKSATGVEMLSARVATTGGTVDIRGLAGVPQPTPLPVPLGVTVTGVSSAQSVVTTTGAGGTISLTGESTGSGAGIAVDASSAVGQAGTSGDIVLRALNGVNGTQALVLSGANTVTSSGRVDLRPGGVNADGSIREATATPISIGAGSSGFILTTGTLAALAQGFDTVVIGSREQAGAITVGAATTFRDNVTLQNQGGTGGIAIQAPLSVSTPNKTIALLSGGSIVQQAPTVVLAALARPAAVPVIGGSNGASITAANLLATADSGDIVLVDSGNQVSGAFSGVAQQGGVRFVNAGPLTVGPVTATGYTTGPGGALSFAPVRSLAGGAGGFFGRSLNGTVALGQDIQSVTDIDLVAATVFANPGSHVLFVGEGGAWRVWADTWVGETRGGLAGTGAAPNIYGCGYPGPCTPPVAPPVDNHFIYVQAQPIVIPPAPAPVTPPATPPINVNDFGSISQVTDQSTSLVYGRNLNTTLMCANSGNFELKRTSEDESDPLARDWTRLRQQPRLNGCVDLGQHSQCSDF